MVRLGDLDHREFVFANVVHPTDESHALLKIVFTTFPSMHTTVPYFYVPKPARLQVWDTPDMIPKWEAFVHEHDVPDFLDRFADELKAAEQFFEGQRIEQKRAADEKFGS